MTADTPLYILRPDNSVDGPFTLSQTRNLWQSGSITLNHQIATEGGEWRPAAYYRQMLEFSERDQREKAQEEIAAAYDLKKKSGPMAAGLNFLLPGVGYFYTGAIIPGLAMLFFIVLLAMSPFYGTAFVVWVVGVIDGFLCADRYNKKLLTDLNTAAGK